MTRRRPPWRWLVELGVTQPVEPPVPSDDAHFLASKGPLRVAQRVAKQRIELAWSGQRALRRERIDPAWRRAVWLHTEDPQIGDALMDLAPRSLLAERGIALDLLAPAATATLFTGDRALRRVVADEAAIDGADFDFAIVDSDSWQALAAKRRRAPALPWVSIRGAYLGYDFQRGLLATRRLAALLGVRLDAGEEARHARQKLLIDGLDAEAATAQGDASPIEVVIALGGVRAERSYRRWPEVARRLAARRGCVFTLLGSANAREDRDAFLAAATAAKPLEVTDRVEQTSLHDAARAMSRADLVLCADGGLMHVALATETPVVALFDASVDPAWRLPARLHGSALRAGGRDVNGIEPSRIADAALAQLALPHGH